MESLTVGNRNVSSERTDKDMSEKHRSHTESTGPMGRQGLGEEMAPPGGPYYAPPPHGYYYGDADEIDLRQYIEIIWKWKWIIAAVTLSAVAAAGILSFFVMTPVFEASTQIMVPRSVLPNDVITTPYFLQKVLTQLNLGSEYDPFTLSRAISVQASKLPDLSIIKVQDKDPATAEKIVNAVADCFVDFVRDHNSQVSSGIVKELQAKTQESENALSALKAQRDQLVSGQDLPAQRLEVSRLASLVTDRRTALLQGESRQKELQKGIEELERSLAATPKTVPGPLDYAGRPTVVPNDTYQQLEQNLAFKKVALAEVQVQLENIRAVLPGLESQYQVKQKTVLELESRLNDIEENISRLNTEIAAFNTEIVKTSSSLPEASVVAPAITPRLPVKPRKLLNMAVAGVLAGFVSLFGVFFIEYWRSPRKYTNVGSPS